MHVLIGLGCFALAAVLDAVWARYIKAAAAGLKLAAANWSLLIYVLGGTITLQYVHDHTVLLWAAAGSWIGTYLGTEKS